MSERMGPEITTSRSCHGCAHVRYSVQGDSGFTVTCGAVARRIGDTTWNTPDWCPLMPGRVDQAARILELEATLGDVVTSLQYDLRHLWRGHCPIPSCPDSRDLDCAACRILLAAEATLRGETTDAPE